MRVALSRRGAAVAGIGVLDTLLSRYGRQHAGGQMPGPKEPYACVQAAVVARLT